MKRGRENVDNKSEEVFNVVVFEVTRLLFSDGNMTDVNLRLVRIALEHRGLRTFIDKTFCNE